MAKNEKLKQSIEVTKNILLQLDKESDLRLIPGACKIGTVWLPIPPSSITVSEVNQNEAIPTIRTPGNPKIKTGQQEIRIELEVFFPSLYDINTRFRPLLAQFIRSPFLPLENDHVRSLVLPRVVWSEPAEKERLKLTNPMPQDKVIYEREISKDLTKGTLVNKTEEFKREVKKLYREKQEKLDSKIKNLNVNIETKNIKLNAVPFFEREVIENEILGFRKQILNLLNKKARIKESDVATELLENDKAKWSQPTSTYDDEQLAIVLRNINVSTVPGFPGALQCNLTLSYFNFYPYSIDFTFIEKLDDALKQVEYFSSKENLKHPEEVRNLKDLVIFKRPHVDKTKNLSDSEPFLSYLTPLLTGESLEYRNRELPMIISKENSGDGVSSGPTTVDSGFIFSAPGNWLREVTNVKSFKGFHLQYEIPEQSPDERTVLEDLMNGINASLLADVSDLIGSLKGRGNLGKIKDELLFIGQKIIKVISLGLLVEKYEEAIAKLSDSELEIIRLPFDIKKRGPGGRDIVIFERDKPYSTREFMNKFKTLEGTRNDPNSSPITGEGILNKLKTNLEVVNFYTYGFITSYKFEFKEDDDTIITGISAALGNKLATIPLVSHSLPTFQYMGREDWTVQINIQTCNRVLFEILRSLSIKASRSMKVKNRTGENWWIAKSNSIYFDPDNELNGFLKMIGCNNMLFQDFVYETIREKPGWWNITIRLVQADLDLYLYESLLPVGFFTRELIEDVKNVLMKKYTWKGIGGPPSLGYVSEEKFRDYPYNTFLKEYPYITRYVFSEMRKYVFGVAYNVMYGLTGRPSVPDISTDESPDNIYILTEDEVKQIINNKMSENIFEFILRKKFSSYAEKGVKISKHAIGGPGAQASFKHELPDGTRLSQHAFDNRMNGILLDLPGVKKLEFSKLRFALVKFFLQTMAIRVLLAAPAEMQKLMNKNKKLLGTSSRQQTGYKSQDMRPIQKLNATIGYIQDPKTAATDMNDMYSNYFDLNLPSYRGGALSTPADFFYKKYDSDIVPFDFVESRIRSKQEEYNEYWKSTGLYGIAMLEEMGARKDVEGYFPPNVADLARDKRKLELLKHSKEIYLAEKNLEEGRRLEREYSDLYKKIRKAEWKRKNIFKDDESIIELSRNIRKHWDQNIFDNISADRKKELVATTPESDFKTIQGIILGLELAEIQSKIDDQKEEMKKLEFEGVDPNENKLELRRNELISQLRILADAPIPARLGVVTPWSLENTEEIANRIRDSYDTYVIRNKLMQMERAYPTIRLYFIEEDAHEWGALDDYYLYNAIENVKIIRSKNAASAIANIVISNISKNLSDPYSVFRTEAPLQEGTLDEQTVLTMLLREGTTIMLKAGYDNNPDNLDVIFYGKVVSSDGQDRMTIVAQSFGAELLEVINNGVGKKLGFNSVARTHGDVVVWAASTLNGLDHFGSPSVLERLGLIDRHGSTPYYSAQKWRAWDYLRSIHPIVDFYYKFAVYDPRFENIYLPYSKLSMSPYKKIFMELVKGVGSIYDNPWKWAMTNLTVLGTTITAIKSNKAGILSFLSFGFGSLYESLKSNNLKDLFWRSTFDWIIPRDTNMWDLLHEISLYHNDCIVTTLPYNEILPGQIRETLYVGSRDGLYKYTDVFDSPENIEKLSLDITYKRKFWGLTLDKKRSDKIVEDINERREELEELRDKQSKLRINEYRTLGEKDNERLNELLKKVPEDDRLLGDINKYKDENNKGSIFDRTYTEDEENEFINNLDEIIDENEDFVIDRKIEIKNDVHKIVYDASNSTVEEWNKILGEGDPKLPAIIKRLKIKTTDKTKQEIGFSRLDEVKELIKSKYPILSEEMEDVTINYFENSGILLSIDNPNDFLTNDKKKKYPGYRDVVNYYQVDSNYHIIENNIRVSSEEVSNRVVLQYSGNPSFKIPHEFLTTEFTADDNIRGGNVKTYTSYQRNIDPISVPLLPHDWVTSYHVNSTFKNWKVCGYLPRQYLVGSNILANQMRPMYRGSLKVIGMPHLKPFDIVFINDLANDIWGPIEVETVIHNFSAEGFTTEITPNAVISYLHPSRVLELGIMQGLRHPIFPFLGDLMDMNLYSRITNVIFGTGIGTTGFASAGILGRLIWASSPTLFGAATIASGVFALRSIFSLYSWALDKIMGRDVIHLCGLWNQGQPWVAGMEGAYKDNVLVNIADRWDNLFKMQSTIPGVR